MANIRRMGADAHSGDVIAPMLRMYLDRGKWPRNFTVKLPGGDPQRAPDGYFHPSTHPTKSASELYKYLTDPEGYAASQDPFSAEARMSVTVGSVLHSLVETILEDIGMWKLPDGDCPCCKRPYGRGKGKCGEPGVADEVLGRRGHMDGVLDTSKGRVVFDLKTINPFRLGKAKPGTEFFKTEWPYYYAQVQDYMEMSGIHKSIVLFMGIGYPWKMTEYELDYDEEYTNDFLRKYRRVRDAVESGNIPGDIAWN